MARVAIYIDGHNVHGSIKRWQEQTNECLKWLDYWKFGLKVVSDSALGLTDAGKLVLVNYYTALPVENNERKNRHEVYIDAIEASAAAAGGAIRTVYGFYRMVRNGERCDNCGYTWNSRKEKKSDTTLCSELLDDAYQDRYDCAVVVSQDSDMAPPMQIIKNRFTDKRVITAYPPLTNRGARNRDLEDASHASIRTIGLMRACQMPDPVIGADGNELRCPAQWVSR